MNDDPAPFLSQLLINRDPLGAVWLLWQCITDPPEWFETFELTGTRKESSHE